MPFTVLEDFVQDLLKESIIKNYTAQRQTVREFYNKKYRDVGKMSFHDFNYNLWKYWYINSFTKNTIKFDERWINYFALKVGGTSVNKEPFNEQAYVNANKCILCNVSFDDQETYDNHLNILSHKIRLSYVKNKSSFKNNNEVKTFLMMYGKKCTDKKIQIRVKADMQATLRIHNNSKNVINIMDVVKINALLQDVTLEEQFEKGVLVKPSAYVEVTINAYFEHSDSFVYPIVLVTEENKSQKQSFHLIMVELESVSEFSYLKSDNKTFVNKVPDAFTIFSGLNDIIIPGQRPEDLTSYYKEKLTLGQFKIPKELEKIFQELLTKYPEFGMRIPKLYKTFSSALDIVPGIDEFNYYTNLEKLLHIEENQLRIDIRNYDTVSTLQPLEGRSLYELQVPGLAEARPSLLRNDTVYIKENKDDVVKYEGCIHEVRETSVYIGLNHRFDKIFISKKKFHVEFGFNRRPIRVEKQALFLAHKHGIISMLYPKEIEIGLLTKTNVTLSNRMLNEEQTLAVQNIVKHRDYPFIVFGPPGTGKTLTIVESVYQIWKNYPNSRILVCAPSNAATNEVAARLRKIIPKTELFRCLGATYGQKIELKEIEDIVNLRHGEFYMPSMEDLLKYRILLTTIVTSARLVNGGVPPNHFSHVFIDESGYATETQTLIPIAGILSNCEQNGNVLAQVVLAGDPQQLGPLIHSGFAQHCGYGRSMLERLTYDKLYSKTENTSFNERCVTKLVRNYRSHEAILKTSSTLFYNNELIAAGNQFTSLFVGSSHLKNKKFPVIFHNVEGEDVRDESSPSFFNVQEIEQTMEYLSELISSKVSGISIQQSHIGVITPYRKQAEKLKEACASRNWNKLLIGSVEQFQGKERLIIIISTVRSKNTSKFEHIDRMCDIGFLKSPKRLNVALTRAKALLIVIGNGTVLKSDTNWSSFIQHCSDNNSITGKILRSV